MRWFRSDLIFILLCTEIQVWGEDFRRVEAIRGNGSAFVGELQSKKSGELSVIQGNQQESFRQIQRLRFSSVPIKPLPGKLIQVIRFPDDQLIYGIVEKYDDQTLFLSTSWAKSLSIPSTWVNRIDVSSEGYPTYLEEFERIPKTWKWSGNPSLTNQIALSGRRSLLFNEADQQGTYFLNEPLASGRLKCFFHLPKIPNNQPVSVEMIFGVGKSSKSIRIELLGNEKSYKVFGLGEKIKPAEVLRTEGWHRLWIEWDDRHSQAMMGPYVLWSDTKNGIQQPLREIRVQSNGKGEGVALDDLVLFRTGEKQRVWSRVDWSQDEILRTSQDQLLGKLTSWTSRGIDLEQREESRLYSLTEVIQVAFQSGTIPSKSTRGEHVRLRLHSNDPDGDWIEGAVQSVNAKSLELDHSVLGKLTIPLAACREMVPQFFGTRLVIDSTPHHLGDREQYSFRVRKPEDVRLTKSFPLQDISENNSLIIDASHLLGSGDGKKIADSLKRGDLRTEVVLNGHVIDYLNRFSNRSTSEVIRIRIPLKKDQLVQGENRIEIRQIPEATGTRPDSEILGIRLEIPIRSQ
jgi:hypothetical protein